MDMPLISSAINTLSNFFGHFILLSIHSKLLLEVKVVIILNKGIGI